METQPVTVDRSAEVLIMKGNLLLIDDESILIDCLKSVLEDYADNILTADNGSSGYDVFKKNEIHCIVCDINMPVMNGVELIRKLRAENIDVPFIFYTGHGNRDLMLEAAQYGAFDFLDKPLLHGLDECVKRALALRLNADVNLTPDDFMSEYSKMLLELEK